MGFPDDFIWGAAASAYQIEGAAFEDGKGWSVWDMMCRKEGATWKGQTGDVACDHYHRYQEDVGIMKTLGLHSYRMSISWPRVMPEGTGAINPKGMDFYDRLIDELLAAGIIPFVTLFHWDYPYELYCRGGWLNPGSPDWFADYVRVIVDKFGDRVKHWLTLNEPQCFIGLGHLTGFQAPGDKLGFREVLRAAHHALLAHGKGVQTIRATSPQPCQVGLAPVGSAKVPATDKPEDIEAARELMFRVVTKDLWQKTWWMDPIYWGRYPVDGLKLFGDAVPQVKSGDMDIINQPLDFFGVNHYSSQKVIRGKDGEPEEIELPTGYAMSAIRTAVVPEVLYWGPRYYYERYKLPVYIFENGLSTTDYVSLDGRVHDSQKVEYTRRHLLQFRKAGEDGVPIKGYFHWSILDNFEFTEGYKERFGLVFVDYPTQKRIPKDSAYWYAKVIKTNGAYLDTHPSLGPEDLYQELGG